MERLEEQQRERTDRFQREFDRQRQRRLSEEYLNQQRMNGVLDYMIRDKELRQRERERPCQPGAIAC